MAKNQNLSFSLIFINSLIRNIVEINLPIPSEFRFLTGTLLAGKCMVGNSTTEFHLSTIHASSALRVRISTWPGKHLLVPKITLSKEDVHTHCATYVIVQSFIPWDPSMQYTTCSVDTLALVWLGESRKKYVDSSINGHYQGWWKRRVGGCMPTRFWHIINPISTKGGGRLCPPITTCPPPRLSDLPPSLEGVL